MIFQTKCLNQQKLDRLAPLVEDPPRWNFTTKQNPPICNSPLYIVVTIDPILGQNSFLYIYDLLQPELLQD